MRVVTWNVNGIRAAIRKGIDGFVDDIAPDILLLQEIRCLPEQLPKGWVPPLGETHWHPAERKGYAGVSTHANRPFSVEGTGIDTELDPADGEGRMLHTIHDGLHCLNCYLPSGSSKEERQRWKEDWMEDLLTWAAPFAEMDAPVLLCGDLNIAHTEDDIWNPTGNKKTSGFLPQERAWFDRLLASGWHDLFRMHVGAQKGPYSWWSNRGQARAKDRGWRIDYVLGNAAAAAAMTGASILREGGLVVSDHAPVIIDFEF